MDTHYSPRPGQPASKDAPLRIGLVGCGRVVERFHLPALKRLPSWRISGACDLSAERRAWAEQALPGVRIHSNFDGLLDAGGHDAVLIATPMHNQAEVARSALEAGLHVMVEKPGGLSVGDALMMRAESSRAERHLWAGYNRRFRTAYQTLRGKIGRSGLGAGTAIRFELGYSLRGWDPVSGIDPGKTGQSLVIYDVTAHQLDLLPWLFGATVEQVRTLSLSDDSPGSQKLEFAVRLSSGIEATCVASHRSDYRETLEVAGSAWRARAFPTGILISRRLGSRSLRQIAAIRNWTERKLMRIGLGADDLSESYVRQLGAFAAAIRGEEDYEPGAGAASLPQLHTCLEALKRSMHAPGDWFSIASEAHGA